MESGRGEHMGKKKRGQEFLFSRMWESAKILPLSLEQSMNNDLPSSSAPLNGFSLPHPKKSPVRYLSRLAALFPAPSITKDFPSLPLPPPRGGGGSDGDGIKKRSPPFFHPKKLAWLPYLLLSFPLPFPMPFT